MTEYWDKEIETMPQDQIKELQLKLFNQQLERAHKAPAYQGKLPQKIDSLDEIKNLPFTCKDDLRQNFPYGFLAVPTNEIVRVCSTSGTTGNSIFIYFSKKDLQVIADSKTRQYFMAGMFPNSKVQCTFNINLSVAGLCCELVAKKLNAMFIPTGTGNTLKQIKIAQILNVDLIFITPNYLDYICKDVGSSLNIRKAIVCGEPCSKIVKERLLKCNKIEIFDNYGLTETAGGIAAECPNHTGLHIAEDYFYCEIINPNTGELVPDGEYGELVVTPLQQEAMPLIRYRTRDITRFLSGDCPCGRAHRRIEPITHRIDDMMIINGVNVFPSQIEECIYKHLTTATNYLIHIKEKDGLKKLVIDIELPNEQLQSSDGMKKLEHELIQTLKSYITVTPKLNFIPIGTLPEIQGKAKRVVKDIE